MLLPASWPYNDIVAALLLIDVRLSSLITLESRGNEACVDALRLCNEQLGGQEQVLKLARQAAQAGRY